MNALKQRYALKKSILAKYDSECPYCEYPIEAYQDYVAKGSNGWGHSSCVNLKIHFNKGGGHPICGTQATTYTKTTTDREQVTCKKCIECQASRRSET